MCENNELEHPISVITEFELLALQAVCADVLGLDHEDDLLTRCQESTKPESVRSSGPTTTTQLQHWHVSTLARSTLLAWADGPLHSGGWIELAAGTLSDGDGLQFESFERELVELEPHVTRLARSVGSSAGRLCAVAAAI
jgi:hypothetical protein